MTAFEKFIAFQREEGGILGLADAAALVGVPVTTVEYWERRGWVLSMARQRRKYYGVNSLRSTASATKLAGRENGSSEVAPAVQVLKFAGRPMSDFSFPRAQRFTKRKF